MVLVQVVVECLFLFQLVLALENGVFAVGLVADDDLPVSGVVEVVEGLGDVQEQAGQSTRDVVLVLLETQLVVFVYLDVEFQEGTTVVLLFVLEV